MVATKCIYRSIKFTIYVHCQKIYKCICTSSRNRQKSAHLVIFSGMFCSECQLMLYLLTIYVYCVYLAMQKSPKRLPNCLMRTETIVVLIVSNGLLCDDRAYTVIKVPGQLNELGKLAYLTTHASLSPIWRSSPPALLVIKRVYSTRSRK